MNRAGRVVLAIAITACSIGAQRSATRKIAIPRSAKAALDRISADSLRGHLSFIASDALGGRNTPSAGLDIAAEYIAAQFRRAGLESAGDDGYFQTADFLVAETPQQGFEFRLRAGAQSISVQADQVSLSVEKSLKITAPVFKLFPADAAALAALRLDEIEGRAVITEISDFRRAEASRRAQVYRARVEVINRLTELKAALIVSVDRVSTSGADTGRLIDPENRRPQITQTGIPVITVHDPRIANAYDALKPGSSDAEVSLLVPERVERPVKLRNVIGVLRGSDLILRDTYVLVTAHYDHLGKGPASDGDNIYNGANDDGSGTVSVIELASALATMKQQPKRSIVFMTFFGEEKGLLGSRYYGRHPVFPIAKTVANVNLEQIGRTDSTEGPQLSRATLTGFDYSDIGAIFKTAGELTGVTVYKHQQNSDAFFGRSDNQAFADKGVPAHTLGVTFLFSDYHGTGDHWDKIDYANMEKVNRMVALGLIMIADNPREPKWNESNPKTARYVKAWQDNRGK